VANLSQRLLRVRSRNNPKRDQLLKRIASILFEEYGTPTLGNFRDPVKEIFYIMLSAKTTDAQYRKTHRTLFMRFPTLASLAAAKIAEVKSCILSGGLAYKRSRQVVATAKKIAKLGDDPSKIIRKMEPERAFEFLSTLPGMGPKSAFCVMMCSLDLDVFPVDANVQRIAERIGLLTIGNKHYSAQRKMAPMIPDGLSKIIHIGLVEHGRRVCTPRNPDCERCRLNEMCKYRRKNDERKVQETL
jgi:endonuclease III